MRQNYLLKKMVLLLLVLTGAVSASAADTYKKITSMDELVAGKEYLLVCTSQGTALGGISTTSTKYGLKVDVTISNGEIEPSSDVTILTLGGSTDAWTFYSSISSAYLSWSSSNSLQTAASVTTNSQWIISFTSEGELKITNKNTTTRFLKYNSSSPRFACYTSGQQEVDLYCKVEDNRSEAGLAWSTDEVNIELNATENDYAALLPTLSNTNGVSVTYSSTGDVADYDGTDWVVETSAVGSSVITASFAGDSQYKDASVSVTINVYDPNAKGTLQNPYTVAEALAAAPSSGNSEEVYVHGIVSGFYSSTITGDSYHRYYISDDGTATNQLLVFNGKGLNGATFSSDDDLMKEDEIVVKGQLTTYNNTKEINAGNEIVSLNRVVKSDPELTFSETSVTLTLGDAFTAPTLSSADGFTGDVTYESSNTDVATVNASTGAVTIVGDGTTTITASFAGNSEWMSDEASYTIKVKKPIEDGVFDFTSGDDYGSTQSLGTAAKNEYTWRAVNVTMAVAGRNAWYTTNNPQDFRLYSASGNAAAGSLTFAVPSGKVISSIAFTFTKSNTTPFTYDSGSYSSDTWTGMANTVTFTYNSGDVRISTITVTYIDAAIDITIGASEYTSVYYSDRALVVPTGVTAHTYKVNESNELELSNTWEADDVVAAGTAVILHGEAGDYTMTATADAGTTDENSVLLGFDEAGTTTGGTVYYRLTTVGNDASTIGFYWGAENGGAFTVGAHKAYVAVDTQLSFGAGARLADIFGDATGISTIGCNEPDSRVVFDLQGRRVQQAQNGLYIVNGKKVVMN